MGCLFSILRAWAGLVLGMAIFIGFLSFLTLNHFSDKLLSADFYKNTIAAADTYNRIYDKVLVDDELEDTTTEFLGDIQVVEHEEIADLLREILPPEYLQQQVEGSIDQIVDYVNEDVDVLEVYVDLSEPLSNVKPVMFAYIDHQIDGLRTEETEVFPDCPPSAMASLADRYLRAFRGLAEGAIPESIPSIEQIEAPCRMILFELVSGSLVVDASLSDEAKHNLSDGKGDLWVPFATGDTLGVLKVSARFLTEPLMDDAIDKVREDLSEGDHFDLIHQLAEWSANTTEAEIRAEIDEGRNWISRANSFGDLTSMVMVIGGAVVMGLVFSPGFSGMLRWPGVALLIIGAFFSVAGTIAESEVPDALADVIETGAYKVSDVPPPVTDLGRDILISFGAQLTDGLVGPSLTLLIIGAILIAASFFTVLVGRFVHFVK